MAYKSFIFIMFLLFYQNFFASVNLLSQDKSEKIDVLKYYIRISINFDLRNIECDNDITIKMSNAFLDTIELDFYNNLTITSISVDSFLLPYKRGNKKIFIDVSSVKSDSFSINIKYKGRPKSFGLEGFVFAEFNNQKIIQTVNQPNYAPSWIPCNDIPSDKALLEIEIINDSDFVSVSNGKLMCEKKIENKILHHYKTFYPISTNLIGIYSANYRIHYDEYLSINNNYIPIEFYFFQQDSQKVLNDLKSIKDYLMTFEKLFGEYPFIQEKFSISEILLGREGIENQTLIGISRDLFSGKNLHENIFIHEIAHNWWGNSVGIHNWEDIWLSEGFATYSEALYYEHNYGKDALKAFMVKLKINEYSGTLNNPKNLFGNTVYNKGAWVLHMIRGVLTDSLFFQFLKNYYNQFKYSSISTINFKEYLETFTKKDFTEFFNDWVYNDNGIIDCKYHFNNNVLTIYQSEYVFNFSVEIGIIFTDGTFETLMENVNTKEYQKKFNFTKEVNKILIDPNIKLLSNFEEIN